MQRKVSFIIAVGLAALAASFFASCENESPIINVTGSEVEDSCVACHTDAEVLAADIEANPVEPPKRSSEIEGMG